MNTVHSCTGHAITQPLPVLISHFIYYDYFTSKIQHRNLASNNNNGIVL